MHRFKKKHVFREVLLCSIVWKTSLCKCMILFFQYVEEFFKTHPLLLLVFLLAHNFKLCVRKPA